MGPFGHRVVLLIEDPAKREFVTRTSTAFAELIFHWAPSLLTHAVNTIVPQESRLPGVISG